MLTRQETQQILAALACAQGFDHKNEVFLKLSSVMMIIVSFCEGSPDIVVTPDRIKITYPDSTQSP